LHAERACGAESIILFPILQPQNIIFSTSLYFALPIAGIRPVNQEEACARIPLNSNAKISAAQDSVYRRRGGIFLFILSSTNMNAPAIASP